MAELRRYRSVVADSARWEGFEFRDGDIVICTPPKCGTTWMQAMCALLVFDGDDFGAPLANVSVWLDMQLAAIDDVRARLAAQTHRRIIKTHTPLDGVPSDSRVLYIGVARDPRDVAVSSANHMSNLDEDRFMAVRKSAVGLDDLPELIQSQPGPPPAEDLSPIERWLNGDSVEVVMSLVGLVNHVQQLWLRSDEPNVVLFHYSDMLADLPGQMRRLRDALDVDVDDARVAELAAKATFTEMKGRADLFTPNTDVGIWRSNEDFFRTGGVGTWRASFDDALSACYDSRIRELTSPELAEWLHNGWLGAYSGSAAVTSTSTS
jgi:hypothetical protein